MTPARESDDESTADGIGRFERATRRRVLALAGGGTTALLSGCAGAGSTSDYVDGGVDVPGNVSAENGTRSASEMSAAAAIAEVDPNESASSLDSLELVDHEFVFEEGYKKSTVQGTVRNTGDRMLAYAEVRVRAFDSEGSFLGLFLDSTADLGAGMPWAYEVILLSSLASIDSYDIAVLGIPE